ncbi:hypothetical protein [Spongiibacter tropicus]|uniref:hypothetical protein n=1 Tax=Spongiibacter tropicus TaxID=454602 RepID=UPI0035BE8B7D
MGVWVDRATQIISVIDIPIEHLCPENLMIQLDREVKAKPYDIGALCFSDRADTNYAWNVGSDIKCRPVDLSSFKKNRRKLILDVLDSLFLMRSDHTRWSTLRYLQFVIDWCDKEGYVEFVDRINVCEKAYIEFTDSLYHKLATESENSESLARKQRAFWFLLEHVFPEEIDRIKALAPSIQSTRKSIQTPERKNVALYLGAFFPFVRNLRNALMHNDFPFNINCGDYDVTILPNNNYGVVSPYVSFSETSMLSFDFETGAYRTIDEYREHTKGLERKIKNRKLCNPKDHLSTLETLFESNRDKKNNYYRMSWAQKVIRGYAVIIQMLTGSNPTQLVSWEFNNALDVVSDSVNKELIQVKMRANGNVVTYPIGGKKGLRLLKEYLGFRDWYLDGRSCKYLFFTDLGKMDSCARVPNPLRSDFQSRLFKQLSGKVLDPEVTNITPTAARKFKSVILQGMGFSRSEVAKALNHTEGTNYNHYSAPSTDDMKSEYASFWNAVRQSVQEISIVESGREESIVAGHCDGVGSPEPMDKIASIQPNCKTQYGCLYCKHYVCHADKEDIHKLLCLKYVIEAVRHFAVEFERADELFKGLCVRVEMILERISKEYPSADKCIDETRRKVYELGELTPFWEARLQRYEEMGVVLCESPLVH